MSTRITEKFLMHALDVVWQLPVKFPQVQTDFLPLVPEITLT
jgi:hypothetical protein